MTARVLLADDHAVLRSGLRLLLTSQNEYDVVGEASSGTETLSLAEQLQPDLILLDLNMLRSADWMPSYFAETCPVRAYSDSYHAR